MQSENRGSRVTGEFALVGCEMRKRFCKLVARWTICHKQLAISRATRSVEKFGDNFWLFPISCILIPKLGEMAEWMKARDSKSRILKRIGGSNPSLSAIFDGVDDTDKKTDYRDIITPSP